MYCLSPDDEEVRCAVGSILENQVTKTGFIARSPTMARITWELLDQAGLNGALAASLVVTDYFGGASLSYPHIATQDTVDSQGRRLGRLIHNLACGRPFERRRASRAGETSPKTLNPNTPVNCMEEVP